MFSFRTTPLEAQEDRVLHRGKVALLCGQASWNPETGQYLFETLYRRGNLKKVIFPAPDFPDRGIRAFGLEDCMSCPLEKDVEDTGYAFGPDIMDNIDALVVDYRDTGTRYDAMTGTLYKLFQLICHSEQEVSVYIMDRENMCGRLVEGTSLIPDGDMSAGIEGIPHRHGLTLGELSGLFYSELGARFPLHIISCSVHTASQILMPWSIPPAGDITGLFTSVFHCGMKLLSGTNISCGTGTPRPYEFFGAPFMERYMSADYDISQISDPAVLMRRTVFRPAEGLYAGQACYGFQMLPKPGVPYHSVAHALRIIRHVASECKDADISGFPATVGDTVMADYVSGKAEWNDLKEHIKIEEQKWIRKARRQMLYEDQLVRVKTLPQCGL